MNPVTQILYYIHDPMCSWCWAFHPVWQQLQTQLPESVEVDYLLGGLAADSDAAMSLPMQQMIQEHWHVIEQRVKGSRFNFDFWRQCKPRRSTYPACRAVIAASQQASLHEQPMIHAIQQAYYLEARNPSNDEVLIEIASQLSLDVHKFGMDLHAIDIQDRLHQEIKQSRSIGCSSFPSLILSNNGINHGIAIDYNHTEPMLKQIEILCQA